MNLKLFILIKSKSNFVKTNLFREEENMSKAVSKKKILKESVEGVKIAWKEYYEISGGEWLWSAPEYYITVKVFESLSKLKPLMLTLEDKFGDIIEYANAKYPGKYPKEIRFACKPDIIIWWANGTPRGIIEVKNVRNNDLNPIRKDISKIIKLLNSVKKVPSSTLQFGMILAYTDYFDEDGKAKDKVEKRLNNILDICKQETNFHFMPNIFVKEEKEEKSAWGVIGCIINR
jgi:hypothetical protein